MKALAYLMNTKVCTTRELIEFKKDHPQDYAGLIQMAKEQAKNEGTILEDA
jgi:hypothetical protein